MDVQVFSYDLPEREPLPVWQRMPHRMTDTALNAAKNIRAPNGRASMLERETRARWRAYDRGVRRGEQGVGGS